MLKEFHEETLNKSCRFCDTIAQIQHKINIFLVSIFERFGALIARKCAYFVLIPFFIGCLAITGVQRVRFNDDIEALSLPIRGRWSIERNYVEHLFSAKTHEFFDPSRLSTLGQYVNLIIRAKKDGGNILKEEVWTEITKVDSILMKESVEHEKNPYKYHDICASGRLACFSPLFPLRPDELSRFEYLISEIPVDLLMKDVKSFKYEGNNQIDSLFSKISSYLVSAGISGIKYSHFLNFTINQTLGKCKFDKDGILISAEAISLMYWLKSDSEDNVEM